jgi:endonuclease G, mitochondrial
MALTTISSFFASYFPQFAILSIFSLFLRMLKVIPIAFLLLFAISCKKETANPTVPNPPVTPDPPATAAVFTFVDGSGNCNPIRVEGSYISDEPLTAGNKLVLQVNVTTAGTYSLRISSGNGYSFSASGSFTATGQQQLIVPGSGTPVIAGNNSLSISSQGSTCGFTVTVLPPAVVVYDDNDHMYFGNPSKASVNTDSANNYLMRRPYNATSYSRDKGIPNWVSWHLYAADLGSVSRLDDFRADNSLPAGWYEVPETAYSGSGFDKGHNTPSADRTSTAEANSSTFLMTNIIPQAATNNQVVWSRLEDSLRRLATLGFEVYIIMGTYGVGGTGSMGYYETIDQGRVTVPANIWKVAVVLPNGDNDSSRVNTGTRIIAVDVPNTNSLGFNWKNYRVSVDAIEAATGYNLLSRLPESLQAELEARVDNL